MRAARKRPRRSPPPPKGGRGPPAHGERRPWPVAYAANLAADSRPADTLKARPSWTWPTSRHSGFRYAYSVYQAEYSRNLIFAPGARMDRVFGTIAGRNPVSAGRAGPEDPVRVRKRPAGTADPSLKLAVVIERPAYDLTLFKVHFGLLTLKSCAKDAMRGGTSPASVVAASTTYGLKEQGSTSQFR